VVTVRQPMAAAIFLAGKDVENKNWRIRTPDDGDLWLGRLSRGWVPASRACACAWGGAGKRPAAGECRELVCPGGRGRPSDALLRVAS
jgi:hypothetical protein